MSVESALLPCENCGAELANEDWLPRDEWETISVDFTFGGEQAGRALPTVECPECGENNVI